MAERPVPTTDAPDWRAIARDLALAEAAAIARDVRRRELDLHQCSFDEMPEANRTFVYGADRAAEHIEAARQHPSPHPPTREQIAEAIHLSDLPRTSWADLPNRFKDNYRANADAVLALIQNGAEREERIRSDERMQWANYFENADASVGHIPLTYSMAVEMLRGQKPFGVAKGDPSTIRDVTPPAGT